MQMAFIAVTYPVIESLFDIIVLSVRQTRATSIVAAATCNNYW